MRRLLTSAIVLAAVPAAADPGAANRPAAKRPAATPASRPAAAARHPAVVTTSHAVSVAAAADRDATADRPMLASNRWPMRPLGRGLSLQDQITDRLTEIGNTLGQHLDLLSHDMFLLSVDGRKRRAHIRFGGGDDDLLTFRFDGDIQFHNLNARVDSHLDLGFRGHFLRLELPAFQVQAADYRGDYGVQIEIPVFEQRF